MYGESVSPYTLLLGECETIYLFNIHLGSSIFSIKYVLNLSDQVTFGSVRNRHLPTCKNKFILMWASSFPGPLAHMGKFNFDPVFPSLHKLPIEYNFLAVFDHGMVLILKFSWGIKPPDPPLLHKTEQNKAQKLSRENCLVWAS